MLLLKPTSQDEPVDGTPYQEDQDTAISVTILPKGSEQQDDAKDTDNAVADEHENKADQKEADGESKERPGNVS